MTEPVILVIEDEVPILRFLRTVRAIVPRFVTPHLAADGARIAAEDACDCRVRRTWLLHSERRNGIPLGGGDLVIAH